MIDQTKIYRITLNTNNSRVNNRILTEGIMNTAKMRGVDVIIDKGEINGDKPFIARHSIGVKANRQMMEDIRSFKNNIEAFYTAQ